MLSYRSECAWAANTIEIKSNEVSNGFYNSPRGGVASHLQVVIPLRMNGFYNWFGRAICL